MPPYHVQTTRDYALWVEFVLGTLGGFFAESRFLRVDTLVDVDDEVVGVSVPQQRLVMHDGTFLEFDLVVDEGLAPTEYSFHFQKGDRVIWRKDLHPVGEELEGMEAHIHPDADKDHYREVMHPVEVDEVVEQIMEYRREAEDGDKGEG